MNSPYKPSLLITPAQCDALNENLQTYLAACELHRTANSANAISILLGNDTLLYPQGPHEVRCRGLTYKNERYNRSTGHSFKEYWDALGLMHYLNYLAKSQGIMSNFKPPTYEYYIKSTERIYLPLP